ncbi:hypothetical protein K4F52_007767 [Lecanicillium sp. MT-2017a]|nr:hypothetical protein K4F52_007767 [Lecanicillium sp. MT-2017a]
MEKPETPDRLPEWSARVRKAIYRNYIVGAALAGVYAEPTRQSRTHEDEEIQLLGDYDLDLSDTQMDFLREFAVYNLQASTEEEDKVFGSISEWLAKSILADQGARRDFTHRFERGEGRGEYCHRYIGDCPATLIELDGTHSDAHLIIWEVTQLLWAHLHIELSVRHEHHLDHRPAEETTSQVTGRKRVVARTVPFGLFHSEDVSVPEVLPTGASALEGFLSPNPNNIIEDTSITATSCPFSYYANQIFCRSGAPNMIESSDSQLPPLDLKFFGYFFRRFVGLQFREGMFNEILNLFQSFHESIAIFSHDDIPGRTICEPVPDPSVMSGDLLNGMEILERAISIPPDDLIYQEFDVDTLTPV